MKSFSQFHPSYKIPLLSAIIFHCCMICLIFWLIGPVENSHYQIDVRFEPEVPEPENPSSPNTPPVKTVLPATPFGMDNPPVNTEVDRYEPQNLLLRPPKLIRDEDSEDRNASDFNKSLPERFQDFGQLMASSLKQNADEASKLTNPRDETSFPDDALLKASENPMIPVLKTTGIKVKDLKYDFIPTRSQIHILNQLFRTQHATQIELYASVDSCSQWTHPQFQQCMDILFDKGWISKEKISPEEIFNFFGLPIEMSIRNRKNPVYQYRPNISKQTLIRYLESHRQKIRDMQSQSKSDSLKFQKEIQFLSDYLKILVEL